MRRSSLTPERAKDLGNLLRQARDERGLAIRRLEAASGVNISTIVSLERGDILTPQIDTLRAIAEALEIPVSDLLTVAGWLPAGELPDLRLYLRAKYKNFDEAAIADLERYTEKLSQKSGAGPDGREDELPE